MIISIGVLELYYGSKKVDAMHTNGKKLSKKGDRKRMERLRTAENCIIFMCIYALDINSVPMQTT